MLPEIPLSLYVHLPWCVHKCPYCDFNSHEVGVVSGNLPMESRYVKALLDDWAVEQPLLNNRRVSTIFFGGGTPSLFSARSFKRVINHIASTGNLASSAEITMEANPGAVETGRLGAFNAAGVNRVSIGVQSFHDDLLKRIGRIHDGNAASEALDKALNAGFSSINVDLMFALPGQTMAQAMEDVTRAIDSGAPHVSAYQLTIEPNTLFASRPPVLPDDELCADMQQAVAEKLQENGFERYEVSAYAKAGHRCRHNINYWQFGDYAGIGAGAHGKLTLSEGIMRRRRKRQPESWMRACEKGDTAVRQESVSTRDLIFEYMLNAMRMPGGFQFTDFEQRTGLSRASLDTYIERPEMQPLLQVHDDGIRPSSLGFLHLNTLQTMFLPD